MTNTAANLKFFWNGIKDNGGKGKLQRCFYSSGALANAPAGTITIYGRDYKRFSDGIRAAFTVTNDSDSMTDYFEDDRIRVQPDHPLYKAVQAAMEKESDHNAKRYAKRAA